MRYFYKLAYVYLNVAKAVTAVSKDTAVYLALPT